MKVHFYVRQGKIIPIFEDMTKTFHLPSGVRINDWDNYYKKTEYYDTALCKVENNITVDWITFKSLSGATSFIYGKPCDIKTSIKFSRELTEDEEQVIVNYITTRNSIFEKIYQSGESFADVLWKRTSSFNILDITDEEILKEDKEVKNIDNMANAVKDLSPMEKLGLATSLDVKAKSEIVAMEVGKVMKPLLDSKSEDDIKIAKPEISVVGFNDKPISLSKFNVDSCIDTLRAGKIPVLVGWAGAGKTYTVRNMHGYISEYYISRGRNFDKMIEAFIPCSNISHNDFWGSFDAVSHTCIGKFKYIWLEAEKNPNILYYVILDEMLDMTDIRKTFGDSFSKLTSLPENMIVVATGNKSVYDSSNETARNMLKDDGILGRFELIEVKNILENPKSEMYNTFFDNIKTPTELSKYLKNLVLHLVDDEHFKDMMLIPRKVEQFIDRGNSDISVVEFQSLLKDYIRKNPRYLQEILFVKKPEKASSEATEMLDLVENNAYDE